MLNRTALILRPKRPFQDWLKSFENNDDAPELERDHSVYLVPAIDYYDELDAILKDVFSVLFESELENWNADESTWPDRRTLRMFNDWFNVELHTMIVDICDFELVDDD